MRIFKSQSAEKSERVFWDFLTSILLQNIKKIEVGPLVQSTNIRKESLSAETNLS